MKRQVLVVSHADADGHVIAEQVRRNLEAVKAFQVSTVVDPVRTKDHRAWLHLNELREVEKSDLVFFVDLMFAPASFGAEADALVQFVQARPHKWFFVLDHHPLPLRRLGAARNLRALYRRDVFDCTIGEPSWMMIIAALCEKQPTRAVEMKRPVHDVLAKGVRRAAALGGSLPGEKLSALLRFDCWSDLEKLGREDPGEHKLPRGRRQSGTRPSATLAELDKTATKLLHSNPWAHYSPGNTMSYDFAAVTDREAPKVKTTGARADDLESIVMLLELAAIYLTPAPGTEFTVEQLVGQAREIGGGEVAIDEKDAAIVLDKASFLKKQGKRFQLK